MPFAAIAGDRPGTLKFRIGKSRIVLLEPRDPRRETTACGASDLSQFGRRDFPLSHAGLEDKRRSTMAVSRRCFLHRSAAVVGGLGLASLVAKEANAKIAPNLIGYQGSPNAGHDCENCKLFEPPSACKTVDGTISPQGWCRMWVKA
jgi:hypothetical protein